MTFEKLVEEIDKFEVLINRLDKAVNLKLIMNDEIVVTEDTNFLKTCLAFGIAIRLPELKKEIIESKDEQ